MTGNKEKILFFINKKASDKRSAPLVPLIEAFIDHNKYVCTYLYWEKQDIKEIIPFIEQADIVAAYGGDGTLNYAGTLCMQYKKTLAVLPFGSGNGLARTLKIPLTSISAIKRLNLLNTVKIDVGVINNKKFFNIAGMGFDAHISALFAKSEKRLSLTPEKKSGLKLSDFFFSCFISPRNFERNDFFLKDLENHFDESSLFRRTGNFFVYFVP